MGFFSDLKEDLSQAVNELMPGDTENTEEALETKDVLAVEEAQDLPGETTVDISVDDERARFDALLDQVDFIKVPEEMDITKFEQESETEPEPEETAEETFGGAESIGQELSIEQEFSIGQELSDEQEFSNEQELSNEQEFSSEQEFSNGEDLSIMENLPEEKLLEEEMETVVSTEEIVEEEGKKMDVQLKAATDENAIITAGMTVTGDINSEGSMEVIGTINGNISILGKLNITGVITGNSKAAEIYADNAKINGEIASEGAVKIGQSSVVIGNIFAKSAVIAGAVKGDIDVHGPVVLDTSAIVMGNIKSKAVQINNGAVIEGMCSQCYADVNPSSFFDQYKKEKNKK